MMQYGVIAFASTHCAIQTEKYLKTRFSIMIMPTPRSISASCGISVRFLPADLDGITAALGQLTMDHALYSIYRIDADGHAEQVDCGLGIN
ncbi:DUF3343 domain-containing protein [Oscillospiraceae bacterium PP1C4]